MEAIEEQGLWPFVSRRIYRHYNGTHHAWQSRHHRKGLSMFEPLELLLSHLLGVETAKSVVVDHIHESPRLRRLHDLCLLRLRAEGGISLQRRADFRLLYALRRCRIPCRIPPHAAGSQRRSFARLFFRPIVLEECHRRNVSEPLADQSKTRSTQNILMKSITLFAILTLASFPQSLLLASAANQRTGDKEALFK